MLCVMFTPCVVQCNDGYIRIVKNDIQWGRSITQIPCQYVNIVREFGLQWRVPNILVLQAYQRASLLIAFISCLELVIF